MGSVGVGRTLGSGLLVLGVLLVAGADARAQEWTGNANFFLGVKVLDEHDWGSQDNHTEFGAEVTWGKKSWPILFATDLFGSINTDLLSDVTTSETDLGIRKIWERGNARPYLGGGLALISAAIENDIFRRDDDDQTAGIWLGGGVFWRIGTRFNIGFSVRYSAGEVTLLGRDREAGGAHAGLLLGWGWPATP